MIEGGRNYTGIVLHRVHMKSVHAVSGDMQIIMPESKKVVISLQGTVGSVMKPILCLPNILENL